MSYDSSTDKEIRYAASVQFRVPRLSSYLIRVDNEGYDGQEMELKAPRSKRTSGISRTFYLFQSTIKELGEASVTASKILMVTKGDTIVYNAAAFRMAEGSMLDNLVRALPGAAINDQGQITVNGEYVSTLLVNGRDFFKGDPKVALSNLPAYAVNKVKVYHKSTDGRDDKTDEQRKRDPLVMDVGLKREYAEGWLANFEAAGGSRLKGGFDKMWLGRVFAMRFTNHSSLAIYGGANNLNDYDSPSSKGEWRKPQVGAGQKTTYMGGINFSIDPKHSTAKFSTALQAMRQTTDNETRVTAVNYLPGGNMTNVSHSGSHDATTNVKWNAELTNDKFHAPDISLDAYYTHSALNDSAFAAQYNEDEAGKAAQGIAVSPHSLSNIYQPLANTLKDGWLYERSLSSQATRTQWGGGITLGKNYKFGHSKKLFQYGNYAASFRYNHMADDQLWSDRASYAANAGEDYHTMRQYGLPARDYTLKVGGAYNAEVRKDFQNHVYVKYYFTQAFTSGSRNLALMSLPINDAPGSRGGEAGRLTMPASLRAQLPSMRAAAAWVPINDAPGSRGGEAGRLTMPASLCAQLPSMRAAAAWVPDVANSFHTTTMVRQHDFTPELGLVLPGKIVATIVPGVTLASRRLTDYRGGEQREVSHTDLAFSPSLRVSRDFMNDVSLQFTYQHAEALPSLIHLLDVRDDSDPLVRNLGNPDLKKTNDNTYGFMLSKGFRNRFIVNYSTLDRNVAMARTYDRSTGVTTYQPLNIDGNRQLQVTGMTTQSLDKNRRIYLSIFPSYIYNHSVDFAADNTDATLTRQAVDNHTLQGNLNLNVNLSKVRLAAKAQVEWTRLTGDRPSFAKMSYTDHSYGVSVTAPLVWGIDLDADLMAYCRSGYTDRSMNTTDWVLNASLAKALGQHKQWLIRAQGFDILGQLSNVRKVVNAQGRTETWSNTVPSYATLHIVYRLDIKPKKVRERH